MAASSNAFQWCPVCGGAHTHCSRSCAGCDDPDSPHPRYASRFCEACGDSFCINCLQQHQCENEFTHWTVRDLALKEFWGKWKIAREFADGKVLRGSIDWWMTARKHFLELGGYYKEQLPKGKP